MTFTASRFLLALSLLSSPALPAETSTPLQPDWRFRLELAPEPGRQRLLAARARADGGATVVAMGCGHERSCRVEVVRYDATGTLEGIGSAGAGVFAEAEMDRWPKAAIGADGSVLLARPHGPWQASSLWLMRYDPNGAPLWSAPALLSLAGSYLSDPFLALDDAGGVLVAGAYQAAPRSGWVAFRVLAADGGVAWGPTLVESADTSSYVTAASVDTAGNLVIAGVMRTTPYPLGSYLPMFARLAAADGQVLWARTQPVLPGEPKHLLLNASGDLVVATGWGERIPAQSLGLARLSGGNGDVMWLSGVAGGMDQASHPLAADLGADGNLSVILETASWVSRDARC